MPASPAFALAVLLLAAPEPVLRLVVLVVRLSLQTSSASLVVDIIRSRQCPIQGQRLVDLVLDRLWEVGLQHMPEDLAGFRDKEMPLQILEGDHVGVMGVK